MGIRGLKSNGWINGTKLRTLKLIPHPSKSSRPAMEIDIKATRPAFFRCVLSPPGGCRTPFTSEATPGKLVLFLTERFKCSPLKGFKWDGNLMSFDEMGRMLKLEVLKGTREILEVHKSITFNIRVPLKRHSNIASAFDTFPCFVALARYSHICAGRTTTLQTWLLELSYNVFQSGLSCFKLDRSKIKVMRSSC